MAAKKPPVPKKKKDPPTALKGISEKPYRTIFEHAALPTIIIEKDSTISLANRTFQDLSGYRRQEIVGKKKWMEFFAPEDIDNLQSISRGLLKRTGRQQNHILLDLLTRKKGPMTWYSLRV
jgi:PAS domain S-box-containing protein